MDTRREHDSLGDIDVPADAMYAAQTQRAVENFPLSGQRLPRLGIWALACIKEAAAATNAELQVLDQQRSHVIQRAASEVQDGAFDQHFPVDMMQTGSGTSSNMNANEVIATRANQLEPGCDPPIHPNDDVNRSQSSNDVMPSTVRLATWQALHTQTLPALEALQQSLTAMADQHADVVKVGRTHLMDAMPITVGQFFKSYAIRVERGVQALRQQSDSLLDLPLGGTAVGNGNGTPAGYRETCARHLQRISGAAVRSVDLPLALQSGAEDPLRCSAMLRSAAATVYSLADDLRYLASGPQFGFADISLPARQPGSSFMPDKVNPVCEEAVLLCCNQVMACDQAVLRAATIGQLELCLGQPQLLYNLLDACRLLGNSARLLADASISKLTVHDTASERYANHPILATALVSELGYEAAAELAKQARTGAAPIAELARAAGMDEAAINKALDLQRLARGQ